MTWIQTVRGAIAPEALGPTLIHEHILCDFIGAAETGHHRWDVTTVVATMLPHLQELRRRGITAFVDCTPMYLGRDVRVLLQLAEETGLHILTNTGLYKEPYLPEEVFRLGPEELAAQWIAEWEQGIEGTGVRPGFIKIAVKPEPLAPIQQLIVRAAARAHLATGLLVACHTGHARAAQESLDLIEAEGMDPRRYVIVHAQNIEELEDHVALARRGAWLEYDGIGGGQDERHLRLVLEMVAKGYEDRLLISQDAGWYTAGEPQGGRVRPYTALSDTFIPALRRAGATEALVRKLLVTNPRRALTLGRG